ncbi:hypothetical protein LEP1GSC175_0803 [Leptospira santarosai str. HAI821]|nr:hypothetical protein LEP1GSC175_0803 [Leptospira santarosai str. HAI821]
MLREWVGVLSFLYRKRRFVESKGASIKTKYGSRRNQIST